MLKLLSKLHHRGAIGSGARRRDYANADGCLTCHPANFVDLRVIAKALLEVVCYADVGDSVSGFLVAVIPYQRIEIAVPIHIIFIF